MALKENTPFRALSSTFANENVGQLNYKINGFQLSEPRKLRTTYNIVSVGRWLWILQWIWQRSVLLDWNTFGSWELLNVGLHPGSNRWDLLERFLGSGLHSTPAALVPGQDQASRDPASCFLQVFVGRTGSGFSFALNILLVIMKVFSCEVVTIVQIKG